MTFTLKVKYEGKTKAIEYEPESENDTCGTLRIYLESLYGITNSKIMKLIKGKTISAEAPEDDIELRFLKIKKNQRIILMGTPLEVLEQVQQAEENGKLIQESLQQQFADSEKKEQLQKEKQMRKPIASQRRIQRPPIQPQRQAPSRPVHRPANAVPPINMTNVQNSSNFQNIPSPGSNSEPYTDTLDAVKHFNITEKVVNFPANILEKLLMHGADTPYTFEITSESSSEILVAVAPKFESLNNNVQIPENLWKKLNPEGNTIQIRIRTKKVPDGTYASFKPLNMEWNSLTFAEQMALLELHLRHRQVLSQDEIIEFHYCDIYVKLQVTETKPEPVISIRDTEIQTNIEPPEEDLQPIQFGSWVYRNGHPHEIIAFDNTLEPPSVTLRNKKGKVIESELNRCFQRHPHLDTIFIDLKLDESIAKTKQPHNAYDYFRFPVNEARALEINLEGENVDLYVLNDNAISDVRWPLPSQKRYQWKSENYGNQQIILNQANLNFVTGIEYIVAVGSLSNEPQSYRITLSHSDQTTEMMEIEEEEEVDVTGKTLCPNCGKYISEQSFYMHEMRCARMNMKCDICNKTFQRHETKKLEKHKEIEHRVHPCTCGAFLSSGELQSHYHDCFDQLVQCHYCPLKISREDRGDHHVECMNMKSSCPMCGDILSRKNLKRHIHREHSVPNDMIDYRMWWN